MAWWRRNSVTSEAVVVQIPQSESGAVPPAAPVPRSPMRAYAVSIVLAFIFFIVDLTLPHTDTPAVGYGLAILMAAGPHRHRFLLIMAIACTALNWAGFSDDLFRDMAQGIGWTTL